MGSTRRRLERRRAAHWWVDPGCCFRDLLFGGMLQLPGCVRACLGCDGLGSRHLPFICPAAGFLRCASCLPRPPIYPPAPASCRSWVTPRMRRMPWMMMRTAALSRIRRKKWRMGMSRSASKRCRAGLGLYGMGWQRCRSLIRRLLHILPTPRRCRLLRSAAPAPAGDCWSAPLACRHARTA